MSAGEISGGAIRPGLLSVTFRSLEVGEVIRIARENDLEGIEWGGDIHVPPGNVRFARNIGRATLEAGLKVAAYGSYYRAGESESAGLSFAAVCETAMALGAPTIRIWAGLRNSAEADAEYRECVTEDIRRAGRLANQAGMTISLEFHEGTLTDTVDSTLQILRNTSPEHIFSYWQPPVGMSPISAGEGLRKIISRLSNVHVFHCWPTSADRHPLEVGSESWRQFFRFMQNGRKRIWAMLEFVRGNEENQLKADARTLRSLLADCTNDCIEAKSDARKISEH